MSHEEKKEVGGKRQRSDDQGVQTKKFKSESSVEESEVSRGKALQELLDELELLYIDLNCLVIEYESLKQWNKTPFKSVLQQGIPTGITCTKQQLYTCNYTPDLLLTYTIKNNDKMYENTTFIFPCGIDIDIEKEILYIADKKNLTQLNLKLDRITSMELPVMTPKSSYFRGLKVDDGILYLTMQNINEIYLCSSQDGKILRQWGTDYGGSNPEEFREPRGITTNLTSVFICDQENHRIQILKKENGNFLYQLGNGQYSSQHGSFRYPRSIFYHREEEILYAGDYYTIQLFNLRDSVCIQRLNGEYGNIFGLCVCDDRLYVSENWNARIQIFKYNSFLSDSLNARAN